MLLKTSKFNLVKKKEDGIVVFNTLSGKKEYNKFDKSIVEILSKKNRDIDSTSQDLTDLIDDGIIVDSEIDEFKKADEVYQNIMSSKVLEFTIIVTDDCNFKCAYCYQENREYIYIEDSVLNGVLNYIRQNGKKFKTVRINWFGGEPLLGIDNIIKFMEQCNSICKSLKISLISGMTTNGYLLSVENLKKLLSNRVFLYQITLDGSRETHNMLRPHKENEDSYDKIIENLKEISHEVNRYYEVVIRINLTKSIVNHMEEFMKDIEFMKLNKKISLNCQKMGNYGGSSIKLLMSEMINNADFIKAHDTLVNHGFRVNQQPVAQAGAGLCTACKPNSYYIDQKGNMLKCSLAIYDTEISSLNKVGTITENGDMVIDEKMEKAWIQREIPDKQCHSCKFYPICFNHYCPFRRLSSGKKICYGYQKATIDSL